MTKQFKPFLCVDADLTKVKLPAIVMPKIDGVRVLNVGGNSVGRSLKPFDNVKICEKYSNPLFEGFDGELIAGNNPQAELLCNLTTSMVNTIKGDDDSTWYVFDYITDETKDLPYLQRYSMLKDKVAILNRKGYNFISVVPYELVLSVAEIESYYEKWLEEGYEGLIGRYAEGAYKYGRATAKESTYFRLKPSSDKEAIVVELIEAMKNENEAKVNELGLTERSSHKDNKSPKGMVGSMLCKDLSSGNIITVGKGKMTEEDATFYWNNPDKIVGKLIKYRSMDTGVKDKPRFPRWISMRSEIDMGE